MEWLSNNTEEWQPGRLLNEDGEIAYWSKGQGPLLLFLHGGPGDDHFALRELAEHFSTTHRCVLYDQRGSGQSQLGSPISTDNVSIEKCLEDISDLRKLFQYDEMRIIGHSWGALLALMYCLQNPLVVQQLALVSMGPLSRRYENEAQARWDSKLSIAEQEEQMKWKVTRKQALHDNNLSQARKAEIEVLQIASKVWFQDPAKARQFLESYAAQSSHNLKTAQLLWAEYQSFYFMNDLSDWKTETLCLYGTEDFEPTEQAAFLERKNKNCETCLIESAGHFPWMDRPEPTVRALQKFFLSRNLP